LRLLEAFHDGPGVAPPVPRVQDERHAGQIDGANPIDELRRLETALLLLDSERIVRRTKLRREILDRDLHGVTGGDVPDVGNVVASRDLRRLGVDVFGMGGR
jgi:hypothetical protein